MAPAKGPRAEAAAVSKVAKRKRPANDVPLDDGNRGAPTRSPHRSHSGGGGAREAARAVARAPTVYIQDVLVTVRPPKR
jgi:hypothetical protein